ncbi:MAG TPA: PepSY-associated TM helix domain-containing protein [Chthoniobacteraceae bacterium]|jgi:uncharacterized iron-regulated membrane protein|nr:PepSY-associated TM helix domain-containing protein [Chthoniobacteraceae bacterium]
MRKILLFLHLAGGLVSAVFLIGLGLSGALLVFQPEIDRSLNSKLTHVNPQGAALSLDELSERAERAHPQHKVAGISLPAANDLAINLNLRPVGPGKPLGVAVNPYNGDELGSLDTANTWMRNVHQFHTRLLLGDTGKLINTWSAIFLAGLSISGLILWWPRKLLRMSGSTSGQKKNFELHNVLGFYSSVFMLLFALTGVVIHWDDEARELLGKVVGAEAKAAPVQVAPAEPGVLALKADAARAIALQTEPGARVTSMQGLGVMGKPIRVWMKFPEDGTPAGRTNLFLDPVSGAVLSAQSSRTAPLAFRIVKLWNREIHTGDIFGLPTRILACLASLALPLLAITGPLIWWGRVRRRRAAAVPLG